MARVQRAQLRMVHLVSGLDMQVGSALGRNAGRRLCPQPENLPKAINFMAHALEEFVANTYVYGTCMGYVRVCVCSRLCVYGVAL